MPPFITRYLFCFEITSPEVGNLSLAVLFPRGWDSISVLSKTIKIYPALEKNNHYQDRQATTSKTGEIQTENILKDN